MVDYGPQQSGLPFGSLSPCKANLPPGIYAIWATKSSDAVSSKLGLLEAVEVTEANKRIDLVVDHELPR